MHKIFNFICFRWVTNLERYKAIKELEVIPKYYGIVCYDPAIRAVLIAPIPLNFICSWIMEIWRNLKKGRKRQELMWAYNLGFSDGDRSKEKKILYADVQKVLVEIYKRDPKKLETLFENSNTSPDN
mgnify:CR=1 FL=1